MSSILKDNDFLFVGTFPKYIGILTGCWLCELDKESSFFLSFLRNKLVWKLSEECLSHNFISKKVSPIKKTVEDMIGKRYLPNYVMYLRITILSMHL